MNCKVDLSVIDNKLYIAINYGQSLFDYSIYEEYLEDLELAIGIVEDLNLQRK